MSLTIKNVMLATGGADGGKATITVQIAADFSEMSKRDRYFALYLIDLLKAYEEGNITHNTDTGERKMDLAIDDVKAKAKKVKPGDHSFNDADDVDVPF